MSAKKGADFLKTLAERVAKSKGYDNCLNSMRITGVGDGKCMAELKLQPEHINMHGGVHGGVIATLIKNATTYALMSNSSNAGTSVDMQVMFLKSAKVGEELVVDANKVRTEGNLAYVECEIRNKKDGSMVAKGAQTTLME